jgi:hypothetical protein
MNEAQKSTESIKRNSYVKRQQQIKQTTGQLNEVSKEASKEANKLMAQVTSPAGSKLHPQQLGKFIDQYA